MALKFQFNKTALQQLRKQLHIRETALPTLQAKEAALRLEVKKAKEELVLGQQVLHEKMARCSLANRLWPEFSETLLTLSTVDINQKKIAGIRVPVLANISFQIAPMSLFRAPAWIAEAIQLLKETASIQIELRIARKKVSILEYGRKKTTQKVNLYEKVQIPQYRNAMRSIKRFLEDEENLSKSAQKMLKERILNESSVETHGFNTSNTQTGVQTQ
ncbi:MAG: V-type ATP synthase subunit D [Chitinivibrionales bacterium]|nr:V-type ATP synthase subunit D [Chitinivibrionales bacterium]